MLTYPQIDPVIFRLGPLEPRWYGFMYLLGFAYTFYLLKKHHRWLGLASVELVDSMLAWLVGCMILGSRTVYVTFYNWEETMRGPWWEPFAVWHGGLAFHGGLLGVVLSSIWVSKKFRVPWLRLTDVLSLATPVGLGLGRIANFINGELWGRVTDSPLGMVFPHGGPMPRHPSQLYQSALEGLVLFVVLRLVWSKKPRVGVTSAVFLVGYGLVRILGEFWREPDAQLGFLFGGVTMGQLLSVVVLLGGSWLLRHALTRGADWNAKP